MAETLRELVVALSLDSSNFSRNMRTINQQIKEAESTFRLAGAGVENYEKTIAGAESKLSMLGQKLTLQKKGVEQYSRALVAANTKLQENYTRQQEYTRRLEAAKIVQEEMSYEVRKASLTYEQYRATLGETDSATIAAKSNMEMAKEEYKAASETVKKLEGQVEALKKTMQNSADTVSKAATDLNNAKAAAASTEAEIKRLTEQLYRMQSHWTQAGEALTAFSKKCETLSKSMVKSGKALTATVTTPIVALGTTAIKASMDYEYAFANVRKTVDATEEEFEQLSEQVKQMSTKLAAPAEEIAEVMAVAGQLGIETDKLADFTRVMIDLGNSTNMVAEDAASNAARFANIMGMSQSEFQNLGSTLVDLGNHYATTESEIMEMSLRLAGAGKQIGLTEAQVLGMSAALSSVGIQAQMGGSAMSKALIKMEVAAATGGDDLKAFAKIAGLTEKEFVQAWSNDPVQVFQRFISNLAQMSDEGISTIAVLNDIGINEIRLRDTLLRTVNASELFNQTQITANRAWNANSALVTEANKRYATTRARLTNLKNTALMFARQIGDDLNPTIQQIIDKVGDLLQKFLSMDETQRRAIVKWAAFAAAVGPVVLVLGKVVGAAGTVAGALGKTFTALGKLSASASMAGGGLGGFVKVLASSKLAMVALSAALVYGAVKLADYATGAKAARDALAGMARTAEDWKNTTADTFYGRSKGLAAFGMSREDFVQAQYTTKEWLAGIIAEWTDGQKETDEIIDQWVGSWKGLTASTREELQNLKDAADKAGYDTVSKDLAADIQQLDAMDKEISSLLKKRQNGTLTDQDKVRLQELIDTREAITVKYNLVPEGGDTKGFETIEKKVAAAVARAQATGKTDADISVYQDAVVAAAEGMAEINAQLDAQYDKEFALISLMTDADEKQKATDELNAKYAEQRRAAAQEYEEMLTKVLAPVWGQEGIKQSEKQLGSLFELLRKYDLASESDKSSVLADLQELSSNMDEGALTEYLGLLTQIQSLMDSGLPKEKIDTMFPDVSGMLDQYAGIVDYLKTYKKDLPGLYSMLGESAPEEVLKIATDLDMTGAQARWDEFAANPGKITTEALIATYKKAERATVEQPKVDAFISKYTEVPEGASKAGLSPEGLVAYVSTYAEATTGTDVSGLTPENITAMVSAYKELAEGVDVSALKPSEITAYISKYLEGAEVDTTGLTPDAITAFVMAYEEVTGGASTAALSPDGITAMVAKYLQAENVDLTAITPDQIEAIVSRYAEATGCDKSQLLTSFTAYIAGYQEQAGITVPKPQTRVTITGYDLLGYRKLVAANPNLAPEIPVRLGELSSAEWESFKTNGKLKVWQDGIEVPVTPEVVARLTPDQVAVVGEDGTLHVVVTPEFTGSEEAISEFRDAFDEIDDTPFTVLSTAGGALPLNNLNLIEAAIKRISQYQSPDILDGITELLGGDRRGLLDDTMKNDFSPERVAELSAYVGEVVTAIKNNEKVSQEDLDNLQLILTFLNGLELTDTGAHIREGIAQGMTEAGWDSDATTVADALQAALNKALEIGSPSRLMVPIGGYVAAGIGEGMKQYDATTDAAAVSGKFKSAVEGKLNRLTLFGVGVNAMAGLAAGIKLGQFGVVTAMQEAAQAAVNAAKETLDIHSPSRVFRDQVGVMTMRGFGEGILQETVRQGRIIANAARYLTGEAREGAVAYNNDNRKTYQSTNTVNLSGNTFYIRDQADIRSLATEIATLTKRQQHGRGLRFA